MCFNLIRLAFVLLTLSPDVVDADTVTLSAGGDGTGSVEISGEIVDFTGEEVIVRRSAGSERSYPTQRVQRIDTAWPEGYEDGIAALETGDYPRAAELLAAAARADQRAWVRRLAMERLMQCYAAAGDAATAGRLLVELARSDPATPAIDDAPLAWYAAEGVPQAAVDQWLTSESDVGQLLGASYALSGSRRGVAQDRLKELAKSTDERIARLAEMQLWRPEIVTATSTDINRWESRLRDFAEPLQAGGWLVVGDAYRQRREFDTAALAYLRSNMLAKRQPQLAAYALWQASRVLATAGEQQEAARLAEQLRDEYPRTAAARQARGVLQSP